LTCSIFRYNFNKVAQYKQLTLEEAEEKMKNRKKTADGYERWMMKAANNGAAAFGEVERTDDKDSVVGGGRGRRKTTGDDEEGNVSDKGEEVEEEEAARKNRLGLNKRSGDDDEEGPREGYALFFFLYCTLFTSKEDVTMDYFLHFLSILCHDTQVMYFMSKNLTILLRLVWSYSPGKYNI